MGFLRPATGTPPSRRGAAVAVPRQRLPVLTMAAEQLEGLRFLTPAAVEKVAADFGTPVYVYDMKTLAEQARKALAFPNAYGLTVRYAMKASPNAAILKVWMGCDVYVCIQCVEGGGGPSQRPNND